MNDGGEVRIPACHVAELAEFFAAHDQWLFGHACVRTRGDRDLAADLVQDTFEAAARAWDMLREHADRRQRALSVPTWPGSTRAATTRWPDAPDSCSGSPRAPRAAHCGKT